MCLENAKEKAITAVNTELLDANWHTGKYIVEFEQGGKIRAEYGKQLLVNLAKDLTRKNGRGFSRSNLLYMRKFYLSFPKSETVSHILTWSHYFEILKCDDPLEMQFYMKQCINEGWKVREFFTRPFAAKLADNKTEFCYSMNLSLNMNHPRVIPKCTLFFLEL